MPFSDPQKPHHSNYLWFIYFKEKNNMSRLNTQSPINGSLWTHNCHVLAISVSSGFLQLFTFINEQYTYAQCLWGTVFMINNMKHLVLKPVCRFVRPPRDIQRRRKTKHQVLLHSHWLQFSLYLYYNLLKDFEMVQGKPAFNSHHHVDINTIV